MDSADLRKLFTERLDLNNIKAATDVLIAEDVSLCRRITQFFQYLCVCVCVIGLYSFRELHWWLEKN